MEPQADLLILSMADIEHGNRVRGQIYNDTLTTGMHPFRDGEVVNTSPVVSINSNNRTITTKSGTTYRYHVAKL